MKNLEIDKTAVLAKTLIWFNSCAIYAPTPVEWERRALRDRPTYLVAHRLLAASLVELGRPEAAREAVDALLAVAPGYTLASAAAHSAFRGPTRERYLGALRKAGLPEG